MLSGHFELLIMVKLKTTDCSALVWNESVFCRTIQRNKRSRGNFDALPWHDLALSRRRRKASERPSPTPLLLALFYQVPRAHHRDLSCEKKTRKKKQRD